jgi:hypothetical protein
VPDDATLVHKTGNETIAGIKTFSSAPSLAGATLTGTVAGGGNQVNNVVIGASTPLAGSFTTISATGALTTAAIKEVSGNVGIGTSSPAYKLDVSTTTGDTQAAVYDRATGGSVARFDIRTSGTGASNWFIQTGNTASGLAGSLRFFDQNAGERMRLDSAGNLLVGYTSSNGAYKLQVNSQIFATSSTVATSDGRYKENVKPITGALALVQALNPVTFNWKPHPVHSFAEGTTTGFIAQEVQTALANTPYRDSIVKSNQCTIIPAKYETIQLSPAVEEVKDEDGNVTTPASKAKTEQKLISVAVTEDFLGIAEGSLISILMAAVKELTARLEALEAK